MTATVVAAVAGILGLLVGRLWDVHSEASRWRRDQQVRVYERSAAAYYAIREAIRVLAMTSPGTAESDAAESQVLQVAMEWNREVVAAWLHGSSTVTRAVSQFDQTVVELFWEFTWEQFWQERRAAQRALEAYIGAVRRELNRPSMRVNIDYGQVPGFPLPES